MATSRGQRPRMALQNGMRPEGGAGEWTVSAATFVAGFTPARFPGALPPASGRRPSGPQCTDAMTAAV